MMDNRELQSLVEFSGQAKVLSVYLDTDLAHEAKEAIRLMFKERIKGLDKAASNDVGAVERYLDFEYDWQARGLAVFSAGKELWKIIPLPIPVRTQVFYADKPYVRVLTDVLDRFGRYGVALIDSEGVRLFSVAGGKINATLEAMGEELKRHRQGGRAAQRYQRHTENTAQRNLKQAVELLQSFCQESGCARFMLAGNAEILPQFKELLPKAARSQIIGEFVADMDESPSQILNRSLDVAAETSLREEEKLVEDVITASSKGGQGVIGLADTLYTLHKGQVHQLLVEENYHAAGYVCAHCGYVAAKHSDPCPFCGRSEIRETPDAVNLAIQKAIQTGAAVNIVRQNEQLTKVGGIAAKLRY